jgi:hypothetical protein
MPQQFENCMWNFLQRFGGPGAAAGLNAAFTARGTRQRYGKPTWLQNWSNMGLRKVPRRHAFFAMLCATSNALFMETILPFAAARQI